MPTLLISYDLKSPGRNYAPLIADIQAIDPNWWHCLDSTWLVNTNLTPAQVRNRLLTSMDANDNILVIRVTRDSASRIHPPECGQWLHDWLQP